MGRAVLRGIWRESAYVFTFAQLLDFCNFAVARGILHDAADGLLQHVDSGDGARRPAGTGDGRLFHDVHGCAPLILLGGALADRLGAQVTVAVGGVASVAGAAWFGLQLPKIRVEARRLIVAQAAAGGEPSEMTAQAIED